MKRFKNLDEMVVENFSVFVATLVTNFPSYIFFRNQKVRAQFLEKYNFTSFAGPLLFGKCSTLSVED